MTNRTHALYRFYDATGQLLYVGITADPGSRWKKHADEKPWWHEVRGISLEAFDSREEVLAAETRAIEVENPRYNIIRPKLRKVAHPTPRPADALVWICETCRKPVANGTGYLHISMTEVRAVERFWFKKDQEDLTRTSIAVDLSDLHTWPEPAHWQIHHHACDPTPESGDYWFDVKRARTHAHLLDWTGHFLESKSWIVHTDWDRLIRRMAAIDA